jgi:hypothetical protein
MDANGSAGGRGFSCETMRDDHTGPHRGRAAILARSRSGVERRDRSTRQNISVHQRISAVPSRNFSSAGWNGRPCTPRSPRRRRSAPIRNRDPTCPAPRSPRRRHQAPVARSEPRGAVTRVARTRGRQPLRAGAQLPTPTRCYAVASSGVGAARPRNSASGRRRRRNSAAGSDTVSHCAERRTMSAAKSSAQTP